MDEDELVRRLFYLCDGKDFVSLFFSAYSFDKPDSMTDEKSKRQMQFPFAARQVSMAELACKWDYETSRFSHSPDSSLKIQFDLSF